MSGLGPWSYARLPASWRGIPFAVRESEIKRGRRTAVHEYPMRDDVWVEDLGRATQVTAFRGFLVGDAVDLYLQAMIEAAETAGEGTLVHPALGAITASLLEFSARDSSERGRVWELEFVFVSGSQRDYPGTDDDTQDATDAACDDADDAEQSDFEAFVNDVADGVASVVDAVVGVVSDAVDAVVSVVGDALDTVADVVDVAAGVVDAVAFYADAAVAVVQDVEAVSGAVAGIVGNYGRFALGARLATIPGLTSAAQAIADANAAAASVGRLADAARTAARDGAPLAAVQAMTEAVAASCADPADAVRLLLRLATADAPATSLAKARLVGQARATTMVRRCALVSLARVCATYRPVSSNDAAQLRDQVCAALDTAALVAADAGATAVYRALRRVRTAVSADLGARGVRLPGLVRVSVPQPEPSLVLAWKLYGTVRREPGLTARAGAVHPLFMPMAFEALET